MFNRKIKTLFSLIMLCTALAFTGCGKDEADEDQSDYQDEYDDYDDENYEDYEEDDASDEEDQSDDTDADESSEKPVSAKESGTGGSGDTWSVFLYLCGTDLESEDESGAASLNLSEIVDASLSDNVNIIVETGGTAEWETEDYDLDMDIDADKLQRWNITADGVELVDEQKLASMGKKNTFSDFLKWGVKNYKADKYMVVLWDHGGGAGGGVAYDELYDGDFLTIADIAEGLKNSGVNFEVVGFDACLMSTLETAAAVSPYANFLVASEELEPGAGWDYTDWVSYLSEDTTMTGDILGIEICDSFLQKCSDSGDDKMATLAVTNLSKIPALVSDFNEMASQMKGYSDDISSMKVLKQAISRAESYGQDSDPEENSNMVDLGDMTLGAKNVLPQTAEKVVDDIIAADVYHVGGAGRQKGNGLSIYAPTSKNEEQLETYASGSAFSAEYLRFIEGLTGWKAPSDTVIHTPVESTASQTSVESTDLSDTAEAETIDISDEKVSYKLKVGKDGYIRLNVTEGADILMDVKCNLYTDADDTDGLIYLGSDYNVDINDDWTEMTDGFDGTWVYINGKLCCMEASDYNDDYIVYSVPIKLNGKDACLRMLYVYDEGKYEIAGVTEASDGGYSNRSKSKLKDGDKVEMVMYQFDPDTEEEKKITSGSFTVKGDLRVTEKELPDGEYYYGFELTDISGESYYSDLAEIDVDGDEISVSY